jgi:hypothetical protein
LLLRLVLNDFVKGNLFFFAGFENDGHPPPQDVLADHFNQSINRVHLLTDLRKSLLLFFIIAEFVIEAAHKPPAHSGDFGGIQGEILLLSHLDRDSRKVGEKRSTA